MLPALNCCCWHFFVFLFTVVRCSYHKILNFFLERITNEFQDTACSPLFLSPLWGLEVGNLEHLLSPFPNYSKMSRNSEGELAAQGHLHLRLLTGSQLVTVPWSSHAERKLPRSSGAGGIPGCRTPGKNAMEMVDLQNSKSAALGVSHRALQTDRK